MDENPTWKLVTNISETEKENWFLVSVENIDDNKLIEFFEFIETNLKNTYWSFDKSYPRQPVKDNFYCYFYFSSKEAAAMFKLFCS